MRRTLAAAIGTLVALSLGGAVAQAAKPIHETYQNRWVNVFWHSRVRVDPQTYLRLTWYAGAYDSGEEGFFSDLYRSVERCRRQEGEVRCRYVRSLSWYGYTTQRDSNSFSLDRQLASGHLDATYRLYRYVHGDRVFVDRFRVVTDLTGSGDLTRGRNSYSSHQGCTTFSFNGRWKQRQATATGTLARGTGAARDLGETDDASIGATESLEIYHTC